ncbi:putative glyoxalase family protein [Calocera viscosa TUFC12733]|uniref:Putative glyoxalase family protein n=1 Tax=Calocera viscosa (strain TUFC12733) TaxID=1330018 RepID=A0A167PQN0_CALVF|nr:putative glyoxalase family protein [Calocera viscosa TUFC12733]
MSGQFIGGFAHVNLTVPAGTLPIAREFYEGVLDMKPIPVPSGQRDTLAWYDCGNGQQIHISHPKDAVFPIDPISSRHPCFKVLSFDKLNELREKIYNYKLEGKVSAPLDADPPGQQDSGAQGPEYPKRFFCRDYAGNRLEFTL